MAHRLGGSVTEQGDGTALRRPASLIHAVQLCCVLIVMGVVVTVLTVVLNDNLIRAWAKGRPDTRRLLASGGLQAVKDGTVHPPAFTPVAMTMFVVVAGIILILLALLRGGYGWARLALTVLLVLLGVGSVAGLRTGPPTVFRVLVYVSYPVALAALFFLWHPDTSRYLGEVAALPGEVGAVDDG
jgi:hypothetical protein